MNSTNPLVSIIIPTYNRANLIEATLLSVQNQTYQNWECIIIDDCSTDRTPEIVKKIKYNDDRFRFYIRNLDIKGAPVCRNIGIEKASGEFIYFFDSDDIMCTFLIESFLIEFEKNPAIEFCCCEAEFFKSDTTLSRTSYYKLKHDIESHLENYGFMAPSYFLKRKVVEALGLWDYKLFRLQDVDYFSGLFLLEKKGVWINKVLFKKRVHNDSITFSWNRNVCTSFIRVHQKIDYKFKTRKSECLKTILGKRITAFSISALASGYWDIAWSSIWSGLKLLPFVLKKQRLKKFLILSFKKPFMPNEKDIYMHY